jgi:diguanylate cyclase (GGDEF)-like protein/PAS domain S-box-containing protein
MVNTGFHKRILAGFLFALGALIFVALQLHRNNVAFRSTQKQLANGHEVTEALQLFLTYAEDAETGQRGYVLTGDEAYLRPYNRALPEIEASLLKIQELTKEDDAEHVQLAELRKHAQVKLLELSATLQLDRAQGMKAALQRVLSGEGNTEMEKIRLLVAGMEGYQKRRNEEAQKEFEASARKTNQFFVGAIVTQFALLSAVFFFVYRNSAYRERSAFQLLQGHVRLTAILQTMGEGLYQLDRDGNFVDMNPAGELLLGYQAEELMGRSAHDLVHRGGPDGKTCAGENCPLVQVTSKGAGGSSESDWLRRKDGSVITVEYSCSPLVQYDVVNGGVVVFHDISERSRMEQALRDSEQRHRNLVEKSRGLICTHDLQGTLLTVNEAAAEALGYTIDELQGKNLCDLLVPQFRNKFEWYLKALTEWGAHSGLMRVQTKDGDEVVWSYSNRVIGGKGASTYVLGHAHDVTAQVLTEEALKLSEGKLQAALESEKSISRIDFLTGIPNRRTFFQTLNAEVKRVRRYPRPLTVAYIDVDNFKQVNDGLGHAVGDELLRTIGKSLEETLRETDTAARLGGDEFAILLPETDGENASVVMNKVQEHLTEAVQKREWPVTFSVGVVTFTTGMKSAEEMIKVADELMYKVKRKGKSAMVSEIF